MSLFDKPYFNIDNIKVKDKKLKELLKIAIPFHGHKCPAMPLGLKLGLIAMEKLNVERASNKELFVEIETSSNHAAGCFADGVMVATGCTFGKSIIKKLNYSKHAFTLIDIKNQRAIRIVGKFDLLKGSKFLELRQQGIEPKDIDNKIADPLIEKVLNAKNEDIIMKEELFENYKFKLPKSTFNTYKCEICKELVFETGIRIYNGKKVCINCYPFK